MLILLLTNTNSVIAQINAEATLTIRGKIIDELSKEPVSFVQVALYIGDESNPIAFSDTNEGGVFELATIPGTYRLRMYQVGYQQKEIRDLVVRNDVNLGRILFSNELKELDEVVVESSRVMMRTDMEGITINPNLNLSNIGGTVLDILRNTPSIRVGDDGSISLRGSSGTNILINGRNSSLTQNLNQIPASAIEQIRIINNPNARYDAEAEGGIIDIILKKGDSQGTQVGLEAVYGTRGRLNTGARVNHGTVKYNVYGGYNLRRWRNVGLRKIDREIFGDDEALNQNTNNTSEDLGHSFNYGGEYYFGKNTISYEGVFNSSLDSEVNTLFSRLTDSNTEQLLLQYVRRNNETETDDGIDNALIYERSFDAPGRSLKFMASNSYRNQYKTQNIDIFMNTSLPLNANLSGQ